MDDTSVPVVPDPGVGGPTTTVGLHTQRTPATQPPATEEENIGPVAVACCTVPHGPTRHPPAGTTGDEAKR